MTWNYAGLCPTKCLAKTILEAFPYVLSTCWVSFLKSLEQLILNHHYWVYVK